MAQIVAVVNQKGGVGKTTTTVNLGAGLAMLERRVLIFDFDPQSNSTRGLGFGPDPDRPSVYDVLGGEADLADILLPTEVERLKLAPCEPDLIGLEVELMSAGRREYRLRDTLAPARRDYDTILIDCPPSLSLLTLNALVAADSVLIPVQCEYLALEGVTLLIETLRRIKASLNQPLSIEGVVLTMFDERTNLAKQVVEDIRAFFQESAFRTVVPRNVRLSEAPSYGKPIFLYDARSKGAEAYFNLAREFREREEARANSTQGVTRETPSAGERAELADPGAVVPVEGSGID